MDKLTVRDFIFMWKSALAQVAERADEFSRLDAVTGDGDHGTAIVQALTSAVEAAEKGSEFKSMLNEMGFNVMMQTSGSTSTLFGGFLLGMSDHAEGAELDSQQVKIMFQGGLEGVQKQTKAKRGDKTMMDALIPAVDVILTTASADIRELFAAAAEAAQEGAMATIDMKANFGRARNYGDRSIGSADAGALSWACIFLAFHQYVAGLASEVS
jgi:phosphoenolpyruvate---glycerone phosphotransferase subunit DhaL